ncbi:MAG: hypothetical protein B6U95_00180 [Thermofilum sp. ex4484_82]|nr:MAG: hypothetical protein B6U95_00180 [Thermofilum sp. ex4484_82]OYT40147.1 MAG: hypothetical protein B6U96_00180 [Archaeoglobales archaeon ex4484_92]
MLLSAYIGVFYKREDAEKYFNDIINYFKENPAPATFFVELGKIHRMFGVAVLFPEGLDNLMDETLVKIRSTAVPDDCYWGVERATEWFMFSQRIKVQQLWEGKRIEQ